MSAERRVNIIAHHLTANATAAQAKPAPERKLRTAVIVAGVRTPFVKSFGDFAGMDSIDLGALAVKGLLEKTKIDPKLIEEVIMGNVVVKSAAPNLAREVVIDLNLPRTICGLTVSRACLSGLQAVEQAVMQIETGNADVMVAGGSDCLSSGELPMPAKLTLALGKYQMGGGNKKGWQGVRQMLQEAGPISGWAPKPNSVSERSTGRTMGWHSDMMAELNKIPRKEQDEFAIASHSKAAKAQAEGKFKDEIVTVNYKNKSVAKDNLIRSGLDINKVSKLGPAFRKEGTVTAASSSALTDGASAVLVMSEEKAKELGYATDIVVRSFATTAVEPFPQLLIAPVEAIPLALKRGGLTLDDIDIFELHEAFASQVLSTLKVLEEKGHGKVPAHKINPNGGSIAIGHPFAATGGRLVATAANELRRSGKRFTLISICAAGGLGGVMILENRNAKSA